MTPTINEQRIALLHPAIRDKVTACVNSSNKRLTKHSEVRITQGLRDFPYQNDLYSLGRTKVNPDGKTRLKPFGNIVTKSKAGQSYHNYGLAVDFCLVLDGVKVSWDVDADFDDDGMQDWREVAYEFVNAGFNWGKSFGDQPHFDMTFGLNWREMLIRYNNKDFITGTHYIRI